MRIFICGASGAGKSSLAKVLADSLRIPFIDGSSKVLWDNYGITSHLDLIKKCTLDPAFGLSFQEELVKLRISSTKDLVSFVTDRTPIDNWLYFLLQMMPYTTDAQLHHYKEICQSAILPGDFYVLLKRPPGVIIEDDKMRITNHLYQEFVSELFEGILFGNSTSFCIPVNRKKIIESWYLDEKREIISNWVLSHEKKD